MAAEADKENAPNGTTPKAAEAPTKPLEPATSEENGKENQVSLITSKERSEEALIDPCPASYFFGRSRLINYCQKGQSVSTKDPRLSKLRIDG